MIRIPAILFALAVCCLSAQAALWTPAYLPATTNALWLDASDATTLRLRSSLYVTNWLDKSGNGRTFNQSTTSNQPAVTTNGLNGLSVVSFNSHYLTSTEASSAWKFLHDDTKVSVFAVVQAWTNAAQTNTGGYGLWGTAQASATTGSYVFADDRNANGRTNNMIHAVFGGTAQSPVQNIQNNTWRMGQYRLLAISSDPGNATAANRSIIRTNGTLSSQANTLTSAPKTGNPAYTLDVGSIGGAHASRLVGGFAEIVFLTGTTNAADGQKMEGYLAWKWGMQDSLPASHPYKAAAPTVPDPTPSQMKITLGGYNNRAEVLTNFPVLVVLSNNINNSGFNYANFISPGGYDLRFGTDSTPPTIGLNYEIESWNPSGTSYVWVQVPTIPGDGSGAIWANWGNSAASSPLPCLYNGATWSASFASVWHMGRTNNVPDLRDTTSYRRDGTNCGTASASGYVGYGIDLESSSSNLVDVPSGLGSTYIPAANAPITVSCWLNPESIASGNLPSRVVNLHDSAVGPSTALTFGPAFTNRMQLYIDGSAAGGASVNLISTNILATGQWYYVSTVFSSNNAILCLNGYPTASTNAANLNAGVNYAAKIGNIDLKIQSTYYDGMLDEMRISSVARSTNWVWAEYQNMAANTVFAFYGTMTSGVAASPEVRSFYKQNKAVPKWLNRAVRNQESPL